MMRRVQYTVVSRSFLTTPPLPSSQLPLWALVSFGLYSIVVIGWSLAHFPTCAKDAEVLKGEMKVGQCRLTPG